MYAKLESKTFAKLEALKGSDGGPRVRLFPEDTRDG